jgi:adenylate cyclase class 2
MSDYEVELKFPLPDAEAFIGRLERLGARAQPELRQRDRYFAHPVRNFAETNEALRLRSSGDDNCITYKGPLLDAKSKTRQEFEVPFLSGPEAAHQMWAVLRALGFEEVRAVEKVRRPYDLDWNGRTFSLSLDDVTGLGSYVEIEILAAEDNWKDARDAALELARTLDLPATQRRSYLQLLLDRDAAASA